MNFKYERKPLNEEKINWIQNEAKAGDVFEGTVKNIKPFGAFVEMNNGVVGLLHIEDISVSRIKSPEERFSVGQNIKVMIKSVDKDLNRVELTHKELLGTWEENVTDYQEGEIRPGIVHRIDKDTSGIIIVAKNDKAHLNISEQIKEHKTTKTYLALVRGRVKENEATIDMPIGRSKKDRKKMAVDKDGKKAVTHFKVLKRYSDCTLLEVVIETGRTHQIRVHLSEIGYPIIGDYTYSNGKNRFDVEGQMLHAYKIKFKHPTTNEEVEYTAELPKYFKDILEKLDEE